MQYPLASGEKAMLSLPRLISSPLLAPVLLRRPSTRHQASSKNAILMPGSRARRLVVRMRVSDRENVVEMAGIDRFEIGGVVEDSDPGTAETILRREGVSANLEATLNRSSKWLVAALFGFVILWKHDAEALWAAMGSVLNAWLSTVLKRLLNQDRPSSLKSDPGMPSSHAQSIFYAAVFSVASVIRLMGINLCTVGVGVLTLLCGAYLSWMRVSQGFHTMNQVLVGAALGCACSLIWFWMWHSFVLRAFVVYIWVRVFVVLASLSFCLAFLFYVIQNWLSDE
ncbi:lipid phosphate phosphatase epsilon 1, chloroplastic-like isoform X1 [Phalaenopsis equestris]|uniref:lipid phosphate phosphatase epsilon 1, chloroplastic-like isoform X1 n=1 Tax=Phalaenopsis equestris TaxID=78828 RepID=UPI0009E5BC29|nr:lipid phosphate phosphatase epsilon 1, chloroplastic-like isoform X1 [Phalaenopsis equestris]